MKEHSLAIPFDIENVRESFFQKLARKIVSLTKSFIRRIIDIILSLFGIILLIPLTIIVFFQNIKHKENGPIFYVQERIGKNGKIFKMYKFRTMVNNADEILENMLQDEEIKKEYETYRKFRNDPRLTSFGKFLRKTSLDEFPQFINVLKGEMSIVGPRPYLPEEKERMGTYYNYIIQHKPGITGVYQISGIRNLKFDDRLDMDYKYHYRHSFKTDVRIAIITMLITFKRKGTFEIGGKAIDTLGYISRQVSLCFKRLVDIIGSIVGIIFLIPLTIMVFIGNRICKDKGPLFYSHERIGKNGKIFKMYKFRSMVVGADEVLKDLLEHDEKAKKEYSEYKKLEHDPRVTKFGNFLRKTSLDEFPQFINVLKGEMSIVGPRAYLVREKEEMGEAYNTIIQCKPGVTGLWQVSGRSAVSFKSRLDIDIEYFNKYGAILDFEILLKTFTAVMKKEGAI